MIAEAIEMHFELMRKSGEPIPLPSASYKLAVDDDSPEELCAWVEVESPQLATP